MLIVPESVTGAKNFELASRPVTTALEVAFDSLNATTVSTLKLFRASLTDMVPIALERRPEKGNTSGERLHWTLILIRPTIVLSASTIGAVAAPVGSLLKMAYQCIGEEKKGK